MPDTPNIEALRQPDLTIGSRSTMVDAPLRRDLGDLNFYFVEDFFKKTLSQISACPPP